MPALRVAPADPRPTLLRLAATAARTGEVRASSSTLAIEPCLHGALKRLWWET